MANSITRGTEVVALPDDLRWIDEFDWNAVLEHKEYSSKGAPVIDREVKSAGRQITLSSYDDFAGAMKLVDVRKLHTWSAEPSTQMELVFRGATYQVLWDCSDKPVQAEPFVDYSDPVGGDYFKVKLAFIEVGSTTVLSAPNQTGG